MIALPDSTGTVQAVAADPSLSAAAVRLQVLELEQAQELVAQGEQAEATGATAAALIAYESALQLGPNILKPYLRIAEIQRRSGNFDSAVRTLRSARDRIGELHLILEPLGRALQDNGEYGEAYGVFQALEDIVPGDPGVRALVEMASELYFTSDLPEEYRGLEQKLMIVREDLAALIAIQLKDLGERVEEPLSGVIMIDIDDSWAQDYIREAVAWRIMEPFQNHAFRKDLEVSRMMFVEVVYRILELINATDRTLPVNPADVSSAHYLYERILVVVWTGHPLSGASKHLWSSRAGIRERGYNSNAATGAFGAYLWRLICLGCRDSIKFLLHAPFAFPGV